MPEIVAKMVSALLKVLQGDPTAGVYNMYVVVIIFPVEAQRQ